ncbi:conserved hypothetical protein [Flavobacterium sp. 9AF]|uniref:reverse transcriptase family protein n=1 Tax=Flavobacterium sp. 9AF TaxID=2653142 RepID=UPI0012F04ABE|nr:reverse transcriptase family protein [Flavobacterium sp. 9AF]VXC34524.1 conserved hypothetical protein [Flavobacterium sp. 9AF]
MSGQLTRQQLYDRIKSSSKDSYILEEMKRLGFWKSKGQPTLEETLIEKETSLQQELSTLVAKERKFQNQELLLKEIHKQRMQNAKAKREETKEKRAQQKQEKAARWEVLRTTEIIYLGEGVSKGLQPTASNSTLLAQYNLPYFDTVAQLADAMGITTKMLTYWAYHRPVSLTSHYYTFEIAKKSGGKRKIAAPKKGLKKLQNWILTSILSKIALQDEVHGFTSKRSIVSNAQPHIGKTVVVNMDLKDFFPSVHYKRVKGLFSTLGYSEQIASILALLCTQAETKQVTLDNVLYYVQQGNRVLPQGSPASPAISNLIAYKLDKRIKGLAKRYGFTYTRYADDLTFSSDTATDKDIAALLHFAKKISTSEDFTVHPDKVHVMKQSRQQKVTGVVVNEKPNIDRNRLRQFRALLHQIKNKGWQDKQWRKSNNVYAAIEGYILFVHMIAPEKALVFRKQLEDIVAIHGTPPTTEVQPVPQPVTEEKTIVPENNSKANEEDTTNWWTTF